MSLDISDAREDCFGTEEAFIKNTQHGGDYIKCGELFVLLSPFDYVFLCFICKNHVKFETLNDLLIHVRQGHGKSHMQNQSLCRTNASSIKEHHKDSDGDEMNSNCGAGMPESSSENNQSSHDELCQAEILTPKMEPCLDISASDEENIHDDDHFSNQSCSNPSERNILQSDSPFNRQCIIELIDVYRKCIGLWYTKAERDTPHHVKAAAYSFLYERFSAHYPSCTQNDLLDLLIRIKNRFFAKIAENIQAEDVISEEWYLSHLSFFLQTEYEALSDEEFKDFNCPNCKYKADGPTRSEDLWDHIIVDHLKPLKEEKITAEATTEEFLKTEPTAEELSTKSQKIIPTKWPDEHILEFIEMYQKYECLWNRKSKDFYNPTIKAKGYAHFIEQFNKVHPNVLENEGTVNHVVNRLRLYFFRVEKDLKSMQNTGTEPCDRVLRRFKIYEKFSFLKEAALPRKNQNIVDYICDLCGQVCDSRKKFISHAANEHPDAKYECDRCPLVFKSQLNSKIHRISHSKSDTEPYTCSVCDEVCSNSDNFQAHVRAHLLSNVTEYICEYCGAKFTSQANFISHIKRHTGTKEHVCKFCNKGFVTSTDLRGHIVVHNDTYPFVCQVCGQKFKFGRMLRTHRLLHGEPKFKCDRCDENFFLKKQLFAHQKKEGHGAEKYYCNECGSVYANNGTMRKHMMKVHKRPSKQRRLAID